MDESVCNASSNASRFCEDYMDAVNLLDLNAERNHDSFCLAYLFTAHDFSGGRLGLAWTASEGSKCENILENQHALQKARRLTKSLLAYCTNGEAPEEFAQPRVGSRSTLLVLYLQQVSLL